MLKKIIGLAKTGRPKLFYIIFTSKKKGTNYLTIFYCADIQVYDLKY